MESKPEKPTYPTIEQFSNMSVDDRIRLFLDLPVNAQMLLVGTNAFAGTVSPEMAQGASKLNPDEFKAAESLLSETPFLTRTENGRLAIAEPMREFIQGDLTKFWEEQQRNNPKQ